MRRSPQRGMIEVMLNGERRRIAGDWTIQDLIRHLELESRQVAVEVNQEIIGRSEWARQRLDSGDCIEIVHFVGGGEKI